MTGTSPGSTTALEILHHSSSQSQSPRPRITPIGAVLVQAQSPSRGSRFLGNQCQTIHVVVFRRTNSSRHRNYSTSHIHANRANTFAPVLAAVDSGLPPSEQGFIRCSSQLHVPSSRQKFPLFRLTPPCKESDVCAFVYDARITASIVPQRVSCSFISMACQSEAGASSFRSTPRKYHPLRFLQDRKHSRHLSLPV